jgi:hypothetical protein
MRTGAARIDAGATGVRVGAKPAAAETIASMIGLSQREICFNLRMKHEK